MKLKTKLLLLLFVSENSLVKLLLFVSEIIVSEIKKQIYRIYAPINVFLWRWGWGGRLTGGIIQQIYSKLSSSGSLFFRSGFQIIAHSKLGFDLTIRKYNPSSK